MSPETTEHNEEVEFYVPGDDYGDNTSEPEDTEEEKYEEESEGDVEPEEEDLGATIVDDEAEPDWEALAMEKGWRPEDDYTGRKENFVDAKTYVLRGDPIMRMQDKLRKQEQEMEEWKRQQVKIAQEIQADARQRAKQEYEAQVAALREKHREAWTAGDYENLVKTESQIKDLDQRYQHVTQQPQAPATPDAYASVEQQFMQENADWYQRDPQKTKAFDAVAKQEITEMIQMKGNQPLTPDEFNMILANTRKIFVNEAQAAPRRPKVQTAAKGGKGRVDSGKQVKRFADLNADQKAAFRFQQRRGIWNDSGNIDKDAAEYIKYLEDDSPYVAG